MLIYEDHGTTFTTGLSIHHNNLTYYSGAKKKLAKIFQTNLTAQVNPSSTLKIIRHSLVIQVQ